MFRISIHVPLRERTHCYTPIAIQLTFQSTLPCGSDIAFACSCIAGKISIHAPLRERQKRHYELARRVNFNPRSLTGATFFVLAGFLLTFDFNSRSLTGATEHQFAPKIPIQFQFTLPHGSDFGDVQTIIFSIKFQFTLPHGSDFKIFEPWHGMIAFQFTLPHGSDPCGQCLGCRLDISIHAPSRERPLLILGMLQILIFQFTLPHGSDNILFFVLYIIIIFQFTLPHGSDANLLSTFDRRVKQFQSTLPRGSDGYFKNPRHGYSTISIHAPSRERRSFV